MSSLLLFSSPTVALGLHILSELPSGDREILPMGFIQGSRAELDKCATALIDKYKNTFKSTSAEWKEFADSCPENDDVQSFVASDTTRFHVPFLDQLFGKANLDITSVVPPKQSEKRKARARTVGSVAWSNNGNPITAVEGARMIIDEDGNDEFLEPITIRRTAVAKKVRTAEEIQAAKDEKNRKSRERNAKRAADSRATQQSQVLEPETNPSKSIHYVVNKFYVSNDST